MLDKKQTDLIIMYYEIKRLRNDEKLSIQRIADFLGMNFRTVRKYLEMPENEFEVYMTTIGDRPYIMDPYKQFIINYLNEYPDTPAAVMHDKLKERFPKFPTLNPKTVYNYFIKVRGECNIPKVTLSDRQYSAVADLPMGAQTQVDLSRSLNGVRIMK